MKNLYKGWSVKSIFMDLLSNYLIPKKKPDWFKEQFWVDNPYQNEIWEAENETK